MNTRNGLSVVTTSQVATSQTPGTEEVRLIRVRDAAVKMCVSVSYVYREVNAGKLGPLIKLGERRSALNAAEVDRWIAQRVTAAYRGEEA